MKYSKIPLAQTLVHHCKSIGISHIVISPGSRNAPLILGFTNDPYFSCYSIVDERSAGFFALGMAQQLQKPVCVLCTSGSALLNYHPAVAEAYYSRIPLVVLSADRPAYKIDIGDGQTIRQAHVFKNHLVYSANLKQDVEHATETLRQCNPDFLPEDGLADEQFRIQQYNETEINTSLQKAILFNQPVHINAPFEEPLYEVSNESRLKFGEFVPKTLKNDKEPGFDAHLEVWNKSKRKMVLIGSNYPDSILQKHLDALAGDESILVFTETTSNVHHQNFFPSIDSIIAPIEISDQSNQLFEKLRPEVLLTFGGLIVSKKIKAFLRNYAPEHHWHVDPHIAHDTYFALSHHYKTNVNAFFDALLVNNPSSQSNYRDYWSSRKTHYINKRKAYLQEIPFTDLKAFHQILKCLPAGSCLQLANSSTIRYAQLFPIDPSISVFCNRGTSGIDGSTSTAVGAALVNNCPTTLITGDLSFIYDSNGLWNKYLRPDFRIVVINNGGGGIFRILPGKEDSQIFEDFFETSHNLNLKHLCSLFDLEYCEAASQGDLSSALKTFYSSSAKPKLLEVKTPRLLNDKILLEYFDFITYENI